MPRAGPSRSAAAAAAQAQGEPGPLSPPHQQLVKGLPYGPRAGQDQQCAPSFVNVDNNTHDSLTLLTIEAKDSPGLLQMITWVLHGERAPLLLSPQPPPTVSSMGGGGLPCRVHALLSHSARPQRSVRPRALFSLTPDDSLTTMQAWACG